MNFFCTTRIHDESNMPRAIIDGLTNTFVSSGFELAPVLSSTFLKVSTFLTMKAIGVLLKVLSTFI